MPKILKNFRSEKALQKAIDAYFESCYQTIEKEGAEPYRIQIRPFTVSGLAYFLGTSRETLLDYQKKDVYSDTIKKAKAKILTYAEEQLFRTQQVAGVIFNLKNNWGWQDKSEVNVNAHLVELPESAIEAGKKAADFLSKIIAGKGK